MSYSQSSSASAATGSDTSLSSQYFLPIYYPDYSGDGPGGLPGLIQAGLHYDLQSVPNVVTSTLPSPLSVSASPGQYAETEAINLNSGPLLFPWTANAHAAASVSIGGNAIHGIAQATGIITPVSYTYVDDQGDTQIAYNPLGAKSIAKGSANITDRVTITSGTLPFGTPVQIQVTGTLHAQVTDPQAVLATQFNNTYTDYTYSTAIFQAGNVQIGLVVAPVPGLTPPTHDPVILQSTVGASFSVSESLFVQAVGIASHYRLGSVDIYDNQAFAGDTSYLNLVPMTPGITLSSDAGIDYAAVPTPEPGIASLLGVSMLGLLARGSRAARRSQSHKPA
ncbi:MAG: hypothetical protein JWN24_4131 [Phycisphaerales bacterium]|nr:hypothetical protein [Phycisphaerales bacterium]